MFAPKLNPNDKLDVAPVLIVGAGPTGLAAAMSLSRAHIPVRLARQGRSRAVSRAIGIQARTLELFEQHRVVKPFLELGHRARVANLYSNGSASRASTSIPCRRAIRICSFSNNRRQNACSPSIWRAITSPSSAAWKRSTSRKVPRVCRRRCAIRTGATNCCGLRF